jgi:arsenate reductase-like glutaredoxin family protein
VLNTRSPAFKARGLDAATLTKTRALELMQEEPNLIKRPLVIAGKKVVFGYQPAEYETLR